MPPPWWPRGRSQWVVHMVFFVIFLGVLPFAPFPLPGEWRIVLALVLIVTFSAAVFVNPWRLSRRLGRLSVRLRRWGSHPRGP